MKLNFLKTLLCTLGVSSALSAAAYDVEVDGIYYNITSANTASVTYLVKYKPENIEAYQGDVVVPETFDFGGTIYTVTEVEQRAFYACEKLTSLRLPSTITRIADNAFFNCRGLKSINIPEGVKTIEKNTFSNCNALEEVELPTTLRGIEASAFSSCSSLAHLYLPDNILIIDTSAFVNAGLVDIHLPERLVSIENLAFYNCTKLKSLVVPNRCTTLGEQCFDGNVSLEEVTLGEKVESIDVRCFADCRSLKTVRCLNPNKMISGYSNSFSSAYPVENLIVPNALLERYGKSSSWNKAKNIFPFQCATPVVSLSGDALKITTATNLQYAQKQEQYTYSVSVSDVEEDGTVSASAMSNFGCLRLAYDVKVQAQIAEDKPATEGTTATGTSATETTTATGETADKTTAAITVQPSPEVVYTLCWLDRSVTFVPDGEEYSGTTGLTSPAAPEQRAVLVHSLDGCLSVSGLTDGERVVFYTTDGRLIGSAVATGDTAQFTTEPGKIVIVRIDGQSFKVRVK